MRPGGDDPPAEGHRPAVRAHVRGARRSAAVDLVAGELQAALGAQPQRLDALELAAGDEPHRVLHVRVARAQPVAHQHRLHPPLVAVVDLVAVAGRQLEVLVLLAGAPERLAAAPVARRGLRRPAAVAGVDEHDVVQHHVLQRDRPPRRVHQPGVHVGDVAVALGRLDEQLRIDRLEAVDRERLGPQRVGLRRGGCGRGQRDRQRHGAEHDAHAAAGHAGTVGHCAACRWTDTTCWSASRTCRAAGR